MYIVLLFVAASFLSLSTNRHFITFVILLRLQVVISAVVSGSLAFEVKKNGLQRLELIPNRMTSKSTTANNKAEPLPPPPSPPPPPSRLNLRLILIVVLPLLLLISPHFSSSPKTYTICSQPNQTQIWTVDPLNRRIECLSITDGLISHAGEAGKGKVDWRLEEREMMIPGL